MSQDIRLTVPVARVLAAFLADPAEDRYGLDLIRDTGLPSGTLYPVLARLQKAGWLEAQWEDVDPAAAGRPARRYYRLNADGVERARSGLAALHEQTRPGGATASPRPAWSVALPPALRWAQ